MPGEHPCAVEDCTAPAKADQLMCWSHWKVLPRATQYEVNRTWRNVRREPEAYREAREKAVAHFRGKPAATQGSLL